MSALNALLRGLFDLLLAPFRTLPPLVGVVVIALVTAVGMLLVVKRTTNQKALDAVKRQIHACLYEIRLFNDDLRAILSAQLELLGHNARYLWLSMPPLVYMLVPFVLVVAQMQFHYGYRGLEIGEPVLVKAVLGDDWKGSGKPELKLEVPEGIEVQTPGLWIPSAREMNWRIAPLQPGEYTIQVSLDGTAWDKSLQVSKDIVRRSPIRHSGSFIDQVLYPAEAPLPAGALASISVTYPDAEVSVLGIGMHWLIAFILLSIVFAFALKDFLGVTM